MALKGVLVLSKSLKRLESIKLLIMLLRFCVASTLKKGTEDHKALEELFNKFRDCCLLVSMSEADSESKMMNYLILSESYLVPAGLELTVLEKQIIHAARKLLKPIIFFSHWELEDNESTVKFMKKKRIAKKPSRGFGDIFFKHLNYGN